MERITDGRTPLVQGQVRQNILRAFLSGRDTSGVGPGWCGGPLTRALRGFLCVSFASWAVADGAARRWAVQRCPATPWVVSRGWWLRGTQNRLSRARGVLEGLPPVCSLGFVWFSQSTSDAASCPLVTQIADMHLPFLAGCRCSRDGPHGRPGPAGAQAGSTQSSAVCALGAGGWVLCRRGPNRADGVVSRIGMEAPL